MRWFRSSPPEIYEDPQIPPDVYEVEPEPPPRNVVDFAPKPDDLVRLAERHEWTRPVPTPADLVPDAPSSLTVAPQCDLPKSAGVYWFRDIDAQDAAVWRLCVVEEFGTRLSIREPMPDGSQFIDVGLVQREWCGPIATPEGATLRELAP